MVVGREARCGTERFGLQALSLPIVILLLHRSIDRNDRATLGNRAAERRPLIHEPAPLFEVIAPLIGRFGFVLEGMSQGDFCNFARVCRPLAYPIAERGPEAMDSDLAVSHSLPQGAHCRVAKRFIRLAARKQKRPIGRGAQPLEQRERGRRQGHPMLSIGLDPFRGNDP